MFLTLCVAFLVGAWVWYRHKTSRTREMLNKFPGPKTLPFIGHAAQLIGNKFEVFDKVLSWCTNEYYGTPWRLIIGPEKAVMISDPKDFEIVLGSSTQIAKAEQYRFLLPWFGTGLLTSSGEKWRSHRKIITPTFHFKILEGFVEVFNANGQILVEKLAKQLNGPGFDVYQYITLCTLDIICETAMGVKINAQNNGDSEYVQSVRKMSDLVMQRVFKPWLFFDFIFNLSSYKPLQDKYLAVIHKKTKEASVARPFMGYFALVEERFDRFSRAKEFGKHEVIQMRKSEMKTGVPRKAATDGDEDIGAKQRLAFLDVLLEADKGGSHLTDEEIREEVDTFMFEGHDTTASAISFALWNLSWHEDVQDLAYRELQQVFPNPDEALTFRGLQELKYLERVIKETLRLYPSVPFFSRQLSEDVALSGGLVAPKGITACNVVYTSLRDPKTWPDPLKFDPDRFTPENSEGRHPYAFVPFSAGPRNCIGQKFAMLEMKATLAHILRAYRLVPGTKEQELQLSMEMVLKSVNGVTVKIVPRK